MNKATSLKKERWLRKITDGTIYTWNHELSRRNDMLEISVSEAHAAMEGRSDFIPTTDTNTYNGNIEYDMKAERKRLYDTIKRRKGNIGAGLVADAEITDQIIAETEKIPELQEGKTEPKPEPVVKEDVEPEAVSEPEVKKDVPSDGPPVETSAKKFTKQEASAMNRANKTILIEALKKTCGIKVSEFETTKNELLQMIKDNTE